MNKRSELRDSSFPECNENYSACVSMTETAFCLYSSKWTIKKTLFWQQVEFPKVTFACSTLPCTCIGLFLSLTYSPDVLVALKESIWHTRAKAFLDDVCSSCKEKKAINYINRVKKGHRVDWKGENLKIPGGSWYQKSEIRLRIGSSDQTNVRIPHKSWACVCVYTLIILALGKLR